MLRARLRASTAPRSGTQGPLSSALISLLQVVRGVLMTALITLGMIQISASSAKLA